MDTGKVRFPRITIQIHPYCNHPEIVPTCIYCSLAQIMYRHLVGMPEEAKYSHTKLQILEAHNLEVRKETNHE